MPVSTAKPPSFYGIVSRNVPELKDSDGDGALELFAYYRHFPPDFKRTVEVYQLSGEVLQKIEEYEELNPRNISLEITFYRRHRPVIPLTDFPLDRQC